MSDQNHNPLTPAEAELEIAFARLTLPPPPDRRESIAYEAGRRAGRRSVVVWRTSAAALAACLALAIVVRPSPRGTNHGASSAAPQPTPATYALHDDARPAAGSYLAIREDVLTYGVGALPTAAAAGNAGSEPTRAITVQTYSPKIPSLFGARL